MTEEKAKEVTPHSYVAISSPHFKVWLVIEGVRRLLHFKNSVLHLNDVEADALDTELHRARSSLQRHIRKIDRAVGEEISRNFIAAQGNRAIQGPFSTENRTKLLKETLDARAVDMAGVSTPEAIAKFQEELGGSMLVQEAAPDVQKAAKLPPATSPTKPRSAPMSSLLAQAVTKTP